MNMTTLVEAHVGADASYRGERGDWHIVIVKTRDATPLERANFDAALDRLKGESDDYTIETSGHWAVGHVDFLVVAPFTNAYALGRCIVDDLEDYPVLDDELYSQYEHDGVDSYWQGADMESRIGCLKQNGDSIFAARAADAHQLYDRAENTYYALQT